MYVIKMEVFMSLVFSLSSLPVMPFWLLMFFAPHARWTQRLLASPWIVAAPALLYSLLVLPLVPTLLPLFMNPQLAQLQPLLGTAEGSTLSWVHFLTFDLFVGRWIYQEAHARGFSFWWVSPVLFMTLMFGPLGLLTFLCVRALLLRAAPTPVHRAPVPAQPDSADLEARPAPHANAADSKPTSPRALFVLPHVLLSWLRELRAAHPGLFWVAVSMVPLGLVSGVGLVLDPRQLGSDPIWLKPLKFALSVLLFSGSMLDVMRRLEHSGGRWVRRLGHGLAAALAVEQAVIMLQALRGQASHFNVATPLDASLFSLMAVFIGVLWLSTMGLFALLLKQGKAEPVLAEGLRWGLGISLLGAAVGFLMTAGPTPEQKLLLEQGFSVSQLGAHAVGVPDGGPGLPGVGWSTEGGDLRVPHFWGLHALQALPLLAWSLRRRLSGDGERLRRLVRVSGLAWLGGLALLTWQALRGQPVLSPDGWTWLALAALLLLTGVAFTWTWSQRAPREKAPLLARVG